MATFSFSTKKPDYSEEGGVVEMRTDLKSTEVKTFLAIRGDNIGLSSSSAEDAWKNATEKEPKPLFYYNSLMVMVAVIPNIITVHYQKL